MRLLPRSLYGRLLVLSLIGTLAALGIATLAIGGILERFVTAGLDDRLDAEIALLARAVKPNGTIDPQRAVVALPYADARSGWGWRIDAPGGHRASPLPPGSDVPTGPYPPGAPDDDARRRHHGPFDVGDTDRPQPIDWRDDDGVVRHGRRFVVATAAGPATIVAAAPRAIVERPIRAALAPLLAALIALGVALGLASLVQLRLGLQPLRRLRDEVAAVRAGDNERLADDQPSELAPLADELNALLAQNAARLAYARGHVANLAHSLKTPLATLALGVRDPALAAEVARIDGAIRHHLGRARADAGGDTPRSAVALAGVVEALGAALARIHADRGVAFDAHVPADLAVIIDPRDLDDLLGNLLDNAWRWARSRVTLTATRTNAVARIAIADDGPGIPAHARAAALEPGRRLDESGDGHGFGLSIARELAALHGGTLDLADAPGGGLLATLHLAAR